MPRSPSNKCVVVSAVSINKRIEELDQFDPTKLTKRWAPEVKALETAIDETLGAVFGNGTVEYNRYSSAASLDHGSVSEPSRASRR
jgi:hypothetical protein